MICRLCLLSCESAGAAAVPLFDRRYKTEATASLLHLISTYLQLELTHDDPLSSCICGACSEHLHTFHRFHQHVTKQQQAVANAKTQGIPPDLPIEEVYLSDAPEAQPELSAIKEEQPLSPQHEEDLIPSEIEELYSPQGEELLNSEEEEFIFTERVESILSVKGESIPPMKVESVIPLKVELVLPMKEDSIPQEKVEPILPMEEPQPRTPRRSRRKPMATRNPPRNEVFINENMKLKCDICQLAVDTYAQLRCHFNELHHTAPFIKCCDCLYYKPNKLVEHLTWHLNPELFQCDICSKQLRNKQSLELHKATHEKRPPIRKAKISAQCHLCPRVFSSPKRLQNHLQKHSIVKVFACDKCPKSFSNRDRLTRHTQAIHENIFPHICETCGKKFKFKPSFERHCLEHRGIVDPPEQCDVCGRWLKNKHALRLHRFKHDNTDVVCKVCGRICPSYHAMRGHMGYMHKLKPELKCSYCSKTFKLQKSLKEHMATHTGAQLYACPHCPKQCRSKSNMYVHIKRKHTEQWLLAKIARSNDPSLKEPDLSPGEEEETSNSLPDEELYGLDEEDDYYDDEEYDDGDCYVE